jgi:two-component system NtrC family sensor kinase
MNLSLRSRLLLSFVGVAVVVGLVCSLVALQLARRSLPQAEDALALDLNAARESYRLYLSDLNDSVVRIAQQHFLRDGVMNRKLSNLAGPLQAVRQSERLDLLIVTDLHGNVLLRARNPRETHGAETLARLVSRAVQERKAIASTLVFPGSLLAMESPELAERAHIVAIKTPLADAQAADDASAGLVTVAAAPIFDDNGEIVAVLCGGQLLNQRASIVDRIHRGLYRAEKYHGHDVGVVSIFLGDKRVATTITSSEGGRRVGTLISAETHDRVFSGKESIEPSYIVDDWYLGGYTPIRDPDGRVIGALGLGLLQSKFKEAEQRAWWIFRWVILSAGLLAIAISYSLSSSIMRPLRALIAAKEKMMTGLSLELVRVERAPPEIQALANTFNALVSKLRERDKEMRQLRDQQLMRSDRLAMIGQLAAGVAHEINNPMGSILLFSRLVMQQVPPEGRARENLERIEKEVKRCTTIVRNLLDFARQRPPVVEPTNINEVMYATLALFQNQYLFQDIKVVREYCPDLPAIPADQCQLQQVFMNLILNAVDAMDGEGTLTIATRENASQVEIAVSDTGCGIPPENLDRIFDPFFTTKGVGHGTGLGLSVSYGIIRGHQGSIDVQSKPGEGATFTILLPKERS